MSGYDDELEEDIKYILNSIKGGSKIVLCCILFHDDRNRTCERIYHLSHTMPVPYLLGEIEMWKMDIRKNTVLGTKEIDSYTRRQGEIDE